jgi:hypothetical protein
MPPLAYTVIATLPDEALAVEYVDWLRGGHVQQVLSNGATAAQIVRMTDPDVPIQVESRYVFSSENAFELYQASAAPALRAEGLARFPPSRGVSFARRIAIVIEAFEPGEAAPPYKDRRAPERAGDR